MCDWDAGGHEETEEYHLPRIPATHPPSKPYLCVGVMERRSEALGMGRKKHQRGQNTPPFGASSPADPHRHPRYPKSAQGGGPRPIQTRAHGSPGRPTRPHSRGKTTPPHHSVSSQTTKTIRHPGKAHLPRLYWTPPPPRGGTDASKTPTPEPGPSACTNPCSRRHTNQDPSPPGPAVTPTRRQSAPRTPSPPPDQPWNSAAARLATYVRRHRHPQQRRMQSPEKQHPRVTNTPSRPRPQPQRRNPPRNPPPGNPQMPQAHNATPRQQQNHSRTESGPPLTLGEGADQRGPERLI